jgi:hypothetical protein
MGPWVVAQVGELVLLEAVVVADGFSLGICEESQVVDDDEVQLWNVELGERWFFGVYEGF